MLKPHFLAIAAACLLLGAPLAGPARAAPPGDACTACHPDLSKTLPQKHKAVRGNGMASCTPCHATGQSGEAETNGFSTRLHLTHVPPAVKGDCAACHRIVPGKSFGLIGQPFSWGAPKPADLKLLKEEFASWANSDFTDHLHAKASVDCAGCHGKGLPTSDSTVENDRCLACHGPIEKLAGKTRNVEFPKRNPHSSHLGDDIACTTCHHAHAASVVYCADCHRLWKMSIPGAAK